MQLQLASARTRRVRGARGSTIAMHERLAKNGMGAHALQTRDATTIARAIAADSHAFQEAVDRSFASDVARETGSPRGVYRLFSRIGTESKLRPQAQPREIRGGGFP